MVSEQPGPPSASQPSGDRTPSRAWSAGRGLRVAVLRGVPVYVSPVAAIFAVIVAASAMPGYRDRLPDLSDSALEALAVTLAILFLISLLLHELGHCFTALAMSLKVDAVTLYGFAGFTEIRPEPPTPFREFLVAVSGPMVNLLLGALALGVRVPLGDDGVAGTLLFDIGRVNIALGILNLLPGLPLDGGRVTSSAVWGATRSRLKGTQAGAVVGLIIAGGFVIVGLATANSGEGLWWLLLAGFLGSGALQSLRQARVRERVPGLTVRDLVRRTLIVDYDGMPLAEALRRAQEIHALGIVAVDSLGRPSSVMVGAAADAVPEARRPWVPLTSVSKRVDADNTIPAQLSGDELLERLSATPASEYVVVESGVDGTPAKVLGVLATIDVAAKLDPAGARRAAAKGGPVSAG
jgi:Zn-dependent protease